VAVRGTVSLSPALAAQARPEDTLFIFARAAQGPRMPIAILKKQVRELPLAFTLDDTMAMSPAMTLAKAGEVVVVARISRSGQAAPQPGDLFGESAPIKPAPAGAAAAAGLTLVIDQAVRQTP
jgi:cytochrome c-type biogenesis protein CcmH